MVLLSYVLLHWSVYFAESLSLFANTVVIWLAATETTKDLKEYKNLLILNGVVDYTCTIIGLFNHESLEITQGVWVHIFGAPASLFPKSWHFIFVGAYSFKLAFGILCLPIQFFYRWQLICKKRKLSAAQMCGLFLFVAVLSSWWWADFGLCFYVSDWKYVDHSFIMNNSYIYNEQTPDPVVVIGELNSRPMIVMTIATLIGNCILCSMIGYFTMDTIRKLEEMKVHMAAKTRKLQTQMNRMLFFQTATVFVNALIPLGIMVFMMATALECPGLGTFINTVLSFIPCMNPICTLVLVHRFRARFMSAFCPFIRSGTVSTYDTSEQFSKGVTPITVA